MPADALIDSNVFMYAAGGEHTCREPCRRIVRALGSGNGSVSGWTAAIDTETYQEIAYRYASIGKAGAGRRIQRAIRSLPVRVLGVDLETLDRFVDLQETYEAAMQAGKVSVRDLLHVAAMLRHGVGAIVTADRDFDRIEEIQRVDPADLMRG